VTTEDRDNLLLYAAGALEADEAEQLRQRLAAGSPQDLGALAEAEAVLAMLPLALDEQTPSTGAKDRLMSNLPAQAMSIRPDTANAATAVSPMAAASQPASWEGRQRGWMALAASLLIFAVSLALMFAARRESAQKDQLVQTWSDELAQARSELAAQTLQSQVAQAELTKARELLAVAQSANLQLVGLAAPNGGQPASPARGRIWWDKEQNQWLITVSNLMPPAGGREYELWFITADERKIPSKVFNTDASGNAVVVVDLPADLNLPELALAAITDEPAGGSPVPTGSIHLVGKIEQ
jgi:hypothetical protein